MKGFGSTVPTVLCAFALCVEALAQTITVPVSEDTWLHGLANPNPQGNSDSLGICPTANYWIYLKFDLTGVSGRIDTAELRMTRFSGARPNEISVYLIDDDGWEEATLVGATRPEPVNPDPATALGVGREEDDHDAWESAELTEAIRGEAEGDGILTLMVRENPSTMLDVRRYFSREGAPSADDRPRLVVTATPPEEMVHPKWRVVDVGAGTRPALAFGPRGRIQVMGFTGSRAGGQVWHASAWGLDGPWEPATVASGGPEGPGDIVVGDDGTAHLAWRDAMLNGPVHVSLTGGGRLTNHDIDSAGGDGWDNSLFLDSAGALHQAAIHPAGAAANEGLQYGRFDGEAWTHETVAGSGQTTAGYGTSLSVDKFERVHAFFCRGISLLSDGDLVYALRDEAPWTFSTVATGGRRGRFPSMALDHWERPHVAWIDIDAADPTIGVVNYGVLNADQWEIEQVDTLTNLDISADGARKAVSLALDSDWRPHLAYADQDVLKYAKMPFGEWEVETVLTAGATGIVPLADLQLDENDRPAIAFWRRSGDVPDGVVRLTRPGIELVLEERVDDYAGARDNTIYENTEFSNGGGEHLFAGTTGQPRALRALLAFDLSQIPEDAEIVSAELRLTVSRERVEAATSQQSVHRLTRDWGEGTADATGSESGGAPAVGGDATWTSNFHGDSTWNAAGGDFASEPSATATVSNSAIGNRAQWTGDGMVADVQSWANGSAPNHGWIVIGDESGLGGTTVRYYSSDSNDAGNGQRPRLTVSYFTPTRPPDNAARSSWTLFQ